jgi:oligopeptide transport system substrate-binding protein
MIGNGAYAAAPTATKLAITAQLEEAFLKTYYRIPLCATTICSMLSFQCEYYTEDYNIMYGFGGLELLQYNYTDAEWADYVASENGVLSYE